MSKHYFFLRNMIHILKVKVPMILQLHKFLVSSKVPLPQKSLSSLVTRNIKNNCHRDRIESALELPDDVLSNAS